MTDLTGIWEDRDIQIKLKGYDNEMASLDSSDVRKLSTAGSTSYAISQIRFYCRCKRCKDSM